MMLSSQSKQRVLVVDDEESMLKGLVEILTSAGYEVTAAASGSRGLAEAESSRPDLILLDVQLPDIDGLEVCRRIKANSSLQHIPVIHLSARRISSDDQAEGLESGGDAYLTHPIGRRELLARITAMSRIRQTQKRLNAEVQALEQRAARLEEAYAAMETFSFAVSHDFRAAIRTIRSFAEILQSDYHQRLDENGQDYIRRIQGAVDRLNRLFEDLLNFCTQSKPSELLSNLDLDEIFRTVVEQLPSSNAEISISAPLGKVRGNSSGLYHVFANLLSNGLKF
ncbi:MAG: response regulator, partial [Limisphaerales bacterium]